MLIFEKGMLDGRGDGGVIEFSRSRVSRDCQRVRAVGRTPTSSRKSDDLSEIVQ